MATRGRPKSDEKREQILNAAGELFASHGYEKTSLDQIAASAGVSKQTIYSHFADKADLLREGVERRCRSGLLTEESLDYSLAPPEFIAKFSQRFLDVLIDDVPLRIYRLCLTESERHPEIGISFFEAGPTMLPLTADEIVTLNSSSPSTNKSLKVGMSTAADVSPGAMFIFVDIAV